MEKTKVKTTPQTRGSDFVRKQALALATAAISRLGKDSPAESFAENRFLLKDLFDLVVQPTTSSLICVDTWTRSWVYSIQLDEWKRGASLGQHVRENSGLAVVNDYRVGKFLLAVGGKEATGPLGSECDGVVAVSLGKKLTKEGAAQTWMTDFPTMKTARSGPGVAVVGLRAYVIGGHGSRLVPDAGVEPKMMYDPRGIEAPRNIWMHLVGVYLDTCEVLNLDTGLWEDDPKIGLIPTGRFGPQCVAVGGSIYVFGGTQHGVWQGNIDVLDTSSGVWSTLAETFTSDFSISAVADRFVYLTDSMTSDVRIYDTTTGQWEQSHLHGKVLYSSHAVASDSASQVFYVSAQKCRSLKLGTEAVKPMKDLPRMLRLRQKIVPVFVGIF